MNKGNLYVITGPSGAGKGTVLGIVLKSTENLFFSVSATTRKPREGEKDGVNYYFTSKSDFEEMINNNALLEYTQYAGNYYGTPVKPVLDMLNRGCDVILEIELEGAMNVRRIYPDAKFVFIAPPSMEELEKRLRGRGTEDEDHIAMRLKQAETECSAKNDFDYIVTNDVIENAAVKLQNIILSNRKN